MEQASGDGRELDSRLLNEIVQLATDQPWRSFPAQAQRLGASPYDGNPIGLLAGHMARGLPVWTIRWGSAFVAYFGYRDGVAVLELWDGNQFTGPIGHEAVLVNIAIAAYDDQRMDWRTPSV